MWTAMTALVSPVMQASTSAAPVLYDPGATSAKTGLPPANVTAFAVAMKRMFEMSKGRSR
jgi:hypothetical protein